MIIPGCEKDVTANLTLVKWFRRQPEHPMTIFFRERTAKVHTTFLSALDNDHPELPESPILLALRRVEEVIIPREFSQNGRFTVFVLTRF